MIKWTDIKGGYADRIAAAEQLPPHELLGVSAGAAADQVRAAYLRLVKTYHPDKADPFMARHNSAMIKLINAAYDKLRDGA
jgi:curved DNA-binding protein CbpA